MSSGSGERRLLSGERGRPALRRVGYSVAWECGTPGAALWARPDRWREDSRQSLMLPALAPRLKRISRAVREIERHHPAERHFYLSVLGIEPKQQGGGIGSALLASVLQRCDADRVPAFLETSSETNVVFYLRHGFVVADQIDLPDGPSLWLMWRD